MERVFRVCVCVCERGVNWSDVAERSDVNAAVNTVAHHSNRMPASELALIR